MRFKWLGLMRVRMHDDEMERVTGERDAAIDYVMRLSKLNEQHEAQILAETGARVAAENETARLRGEIVALKHAFGVSAAWTPTP